MLISLGFLLTETTSGLNSVHQRPMTVAMTALMRMNLSSASPQFKPYDKGHRIDFWEYFMVATVLSLGGSHVFKAACASVIWSDNKITTHDLHMNDGHDGHRIKKSPIQAA